MFPVGIAILLLLVKSSIVDGFAMGRHMIFSPTNIRTVTNQDTPDYSKVGIHQKLVRRNLFMPWSSADASSTTTRELKEERYIHVGKNIGEGSYGTVHLCTFENDDTIMIAKRAWTESEVNATKTSTAKERAQRCLFYLQVERQCYEKMQSNNNGDKSLANRPVPTYIGTYRDSVDNYEWMVLSFIGRRSTTTHDNSKRPAVNLADAIYTDWLQQHKINATSQLHHLAVLQRELGLGNEDSELSFEHTLDVFFTSLFSAISYVHQFNIVHCDIKPANILLDPSTSSIVLIDFGSAIDNSNNNSKKGNLLSEMKKMIEEDQVIVAVSPLYSAPEETFVRSKTNKAPCAFDVYSSGLIFCQLLFNLLDDRTDAAFHQQLRESNYDLDLWLSSKGLASKIRPTGLENGLLYLSERPGLWNILRNILKANPEERYTAQEALQKFHNIRGEGTLSPDESDGPFFQSVIASLEQCELELEEEELNIPSITTPRPLHFVATFDRSKSLGLILSEASDESEEEEEDELWKKAIAARGALPGEVFVRGLTKGGQAESMGGIFEIGDRLIGVGEIPIFASGFQKVVDMLSNQPRSAKTISLHFDRISRSKRNADLLLQSHSNTNVVKVIDHGAWSSKGKRKAQEDSFVLQELHDEKSNDVLIAAVFDGHGGTAASKTASQIFPGIFSSKIATAAEEKKTELSRVLGDLMESSWEKTCDTYRNGCEELGYCVADWDAAEGIVLASTSSSDLVAGTTAAVATVFMNTDIDEDPILHLLHCGDSRAVLAGKPRDEAACGTSFVHFSTRDHSPRCELEAARLRNGIKSGLDYSLPQCSLSRWWLTIGDYQYAVSRSLEGSFATSKGIVSTPDLGQINLRQVLTEREHVCLALASDGLFEVIDNEELSRELVIMRDSGLSAKDAAKTIVSRALKKGTSDNVSVVIIYFS